MMWVLLAASLAGLDLMIKHWVEGQDQESFPRPLKGARDAVILDRYHNPGLPFGLLKGQRKVVEWLPLGVIAVAGAYFSYLLGKRGRRIQKLSLAVLLGGALSNQSDRMGRKYVVDYFSFNWKPVRWIVFNLGDICILLGSLGIFLTGSRDSRPAGRRRAAARRN